MRLAKTALIFGLILLAIKSWAGDNSISITGKIKPIWFADKDFSLSSLGVGYEGEIAKDLGLNSENKQTITLSINGKYSHDEEANPDPTTINFAWQMPLITPPPVNLDNDDQETSWGVYGKLKAYLEGTQELEELHGVASAEVLFNWQDFEGLGALIPSVHAAMEWVEPVDSDMRKAAEAEEAENGFARIKASSSWVYAPFSSSDNSLLNYLKLHGDIRYFQNLNDASAIEEAENDRGFYRAAALSYETSSLRGFRTIGIDQVYIQYSKGKLPPVLLEEGRWQFEAVWGLL